MTSSSALDTTDGRTTRWAGHRQRRRREFVDAALRAVAEHGPEVSVEQIADQAGVARTRLYKHFTDAADLHTAVADRVTELIHAELAPVWNPQGTPLQMIRAAIGAHIGWLSDHGNLHRYLTSHAATTQHGHSAVNGVKTAIAEHLTALFRTYSAGLRAETTAAEPLAFGIVGLVETSTTRWLESPAGMPRDELTDLLTDWVWRLLDDTLRSAGATLDPDQPVPTHPRP
ncbi:TetR/AcrR family transcriptional regulator [Saccharopolyspora sp. HNM0983]|uniref:TetR/AcrR family transcriptional regulator n=1 Tax=Saccharopolyspora montiporae TaxID=2781240 RepID=A0A929BDN6_9PSEU|nr:TetR/AcrR family transcriptional regulator [Saccharopolyspora sp. HNM0983]MBE9376151.1 TetR/AcrR family transcriptional regulator [Saccharopolyspora sp. HNM0983]